MFIKLTKLDGRPVWLNASFIVTVEPRRDGNGSIVVPIGDGLDYDVRESSETVLAMLEPAPAPTVVPVPVSDCLTKTPEDVSPERDESPSEPPSVSESVPEKKPRKRAAKAKAKAPKKSKANETAPESDAKPAETAPESDAKLGEAPVPESVPASPAVVETPVVAPRPPAKLELADDQIVRLRKMAPKSIAKIKNTLATQFQVADVNATVQLLAEKGVFSIDGNRIVWPAELADW